MIRYGRNFPLYDVLFLAPFFTVIRTTYFILQDVEFIQALIYLLPERCLFFQDPADLPLEAGNLAPRPFQRSGVILCLRNSSPEEFIRFHFLQLVERVAGVPQGIEPLSFGGKCFQLRLYRSQLTYQHVMFLPCLLDLQVQLFQFLS